MGAVAELADTAVVMYAGRAVETGAVDDLLNAPGHPYTRGLIGCIPDIEASDPDAPLPEIPGMVPALSDLGPGCAFADRCPIAENSCRDTTPALLQRPPGHCIACWKV
jgi:peptide/nickel transport system ATP-binding protein/oligopeptide transport system ATP-binding protein